MGKALPPLPQKYREAAALPESYGFRRGAFFLSLTFLIAAVGLFVAPEDNGERTLTPSLSGAFFAVFAISALFSRGWSERPLSGLWRLLGEMQFIASGTLLIAMLLYLAASLGRFFLAWSAIGVAFVVLTLASLCVLAWRLGLSDHTRGQRDKDLNGALERAIGARADPKSGIT